jgi:hypothetical protein
VVLLLSGWIGFVLAMLFLDLLAIDESQHQKFGQQQAHLLGQQNQSFQQ